MVGAPGLTRDGAFVHREGELRAVLGPISHVVVDRGIAGPVGVDDRRGGGTKTSIGKNGIDDDSWGLRSGGPLRHPVTTGGIRQANGAATVPAIPDPRSSPSGEETTANLKAALAAL